MKRTILLLALILAPTLALADGVPAVKAYLGANGVWHDRPNGLPDDFEGGGSARLGLTPHVDVAVSGFYGVDGSYLVGTGGFRLIATDAENPNFNVALGGSYQVSSEPEIRPQEWRAESIVGWRPFPERLRRLTVGLIGAYGLTSGVASVTAGLRYEVLALWPINRP